MTEATEQTGARRHAVGAAGSWLATLQKEGTRLEVSAGPDATHSVASEGPCTVLFDGLLHSRRDWLRDFSLSGASDASLLLEAYLRWGENVVERVKGLFALIVWDRGKDLLLCARDPHGMHPFFYAEDAGDIFLSASSEALARHPRLPGTVDRLALADHLCHRWPRLGATYYEGVQRLPGGYVLRAQGGHRTVTRYWDPIPPGRPIDYISEHEAGNFPALFEQAVERCLPGRSAAMYLSGGLDSVSVAAVAEEQLRSRDAASLLGLSLVFEHPDADEEAVQRAVAERLGLPLRISTVSEAVGPNGLVASATEMSASRSAPMINLWNPAYAFMARYATEQGCEAILTGNGGDEWLEAGVHNARLAWQTLDLATVYRLWASMQRSYPLSKATIARNLVWTYGLRRIVGEAARNTLDRTAPDVMARRDRSIFREVTPSWVAPDQALRDEVFENFRTHKRLRSRGALDNPAVAFESEEFYESGRQIGVPLLHPFWDADLTAFLARVPPELLMRGGYSKGLVRHSLAQRFPQIGFERHRKVTASGFYRSVLIDEGVAVWKRMGGAQALGELGIVDPLALDRHMNQLFREKKEAGSSGTDPGNAYRIWYVLSLEAWVRPRLGRLAETGW